ncbi:MAG: hypothetical protein ABIC95_02765 [archaeon]
MDGAAFTFDSAQNTIGSSLSSAPKITNKQLLFLEPELLVADRQTGQVISKIDDTQPLYLFPLNAIDYSIPLEHALSNTAGTLPVIYPSVSDLSGSASKYIDFFSSWLARPGTDGVNRVGGEFSYRGRDEAKFPSSALSELLSKANGDLDMRLALILKNIYPDSDGLAAIGQHADHVRINIAGLSSPTIAKHSDGRQITLEEHLQNINKIAQAMPRDSGLITVRAYLRPEDEGKYRDFAAKLADIGVDILQVTKELQPDAVKVNPEVSESLQKELRELASQYAGEDGGMRFIHVKDISTQYYPKFTIDNRNTQNCYSGAMKPFILGDTVFPCFVNPIISDPETWAYGTVGDRANLFSSSQAQKIRKNAGARCSDCANIFENDFLSQMEQALKSSTGARHQFYLRPRYNDRK